MTGAVHEHGQRFDWKEYVDRVSTIENADPSDAAYHARVIMDLVYTLVPEADFQQLCDQLPESEDDENWRKLFEITDAGRWVGGRRVPNRRRPAVGVRPSDTNGSTGFSSP